MDLLKNVQQLSKALEAGQYNTAPSNLVQGSSLQIENLSPVMHNVTWDEQHLKLQKFVKAKPAKSMLYQFNRRLSYGGFGGSAQLEGNIGQDETSDFVRVVVPMSFYAHTRRVTIAATLVETVDGKNNEDRAAEDAAKKIAGDVEFDIFRGKADFSNAGVFDGNPLTMPQDMPNILGIDAQVRQSDNQRNAKDQMFGEFGSDSTVVINRGGVLQQGDIEDAATRVAMNMGSPEKLFIDPLTLASYNKASYGNQRFIMAGQPPENQGASIRNQWTTQGTVPAEASRFLSGKTSKAPARTNGPAAPVLSSLTLASSTTTFVSGEVYQYRVTAGNEVGESGYSSTLSTTIASNGQKVTVAIAAVASARYFNVYRSVAGGSVMKFIGRVIANSDGTGTFVDLNNKLPGFVTGYMVASDTMEIAELAPYSRLKLAVSDLSTPEAHFRFLCLAMPQVRKNALIDNLV